MSQVPAHIQEKIREAKEKQLKELDLRNNQLTELPESIKELTNLTGLDLSNNKLTKLPESIKELTKLL